MRPCLVFLFTVLVGFTVLSCTSLVTRSITSTAEELKEKQIKDRPAPTNSTERLTYQAESVLSPIFLYSLIGAIILFVASFKVPTLAKWSGMLAVLAATCYCVIFALGVIESIKWVIIVVFAIGGFFYWWENRKKNKKKDEIQHQLITHFDNPDGHKLLDKEAEEVYKKGRPELKPKDLK